MTHPFEINYGRLIPRQNEGSLTYTKVFYARFPTQGAVKPCPIAGVLNISDKPARSRHAAGADGLNGA
jgi:hypothetical protein